jgi:hypothetical protein
MTQGIAALACYTFCAPPLLAGALGEAIRE